jgi:hypothetical protein
MDFFTYLADKISKSFLFSAKNSKFIHSFSTAYKTKRMKNRQIIYSKQSAKIYSHNYKPSTNMWRFMKSILGAWVYGSSTPTDYAPYKRLK